MCVKIETCPSAHPCLLGPWDSGASPGWANLLGPRYACCVGGIRSEHAMSPIDTAGAGGGSLG